MTIAPLKPSGVSIIICCYNSAKRLPETIRHIAQQNFTQPVNYEVLIINNASSDNTFEVAGQLCQQYLTGVDYRVINEDEPGLASARKKGITESTYEFLLFCDDDNWLAPNYVSLAYSIIKDHPEIGILGSQSKGAYEVPAPQWFLDNEHTFAVGKQAAAAGDVTFTKGWVWGAGFIIRSSIHEKLEQISYQFFLNGRQGSKLSSGEDMELSFVVRNMGYKIIYDDRLILSHYMPKERFDFQKLLKMAYYSGKASYIHDLYRNKTVRNSFAAYWFKAFFITLAKFMMSVLLYPFAKLNLIKQPVKNAQRYNYMMGRLSTLLDFTYCLNALKIVKQQYFVTTQP